METSDASPAETARRLCRGSDRAVLSTLARGGGDDPARRGWPYGSLVLAACRFDGAPLLLLSRLALHTGNLAADPRACLLYDNTDGRADPLTGARASVLGRAEAEDDPAALARFLRRHPSAGRYAGFADFSLWRIAVEHVHLVAGFGAIHGIDGAALAGPDAPALRAAEAEIVDHMNEDHAAAVAMIARPGARHAGKGGEGWRMTGIDPFGIDLRRGGETARAEFDAPVETPDSARRALIALTRAARAGASGAA